MAATATPTTGNPAATGNLTPQQVEELKGIVLRETAINYPDIVQMLFQTPSLVFEEKKYWLQLLPLMAPDHVERLRGILVNERQKLAEINAKYEKGVAALQKVARMSPEESQKQREAMKASEAAAKAHEDAEDVLIQQLKGV